MCDCFHMVLPTWPGAPGSVSGRQLQPEEPDAETEEDHSVTEGPVDEIIRPRPQGSSPVYECVAEGAGFGVLEDNPGRQGSSGRRRSWWKRDSGDSRTFSRMSHPEDATEVTLKTDVEAGASGYSVTGGGDQGIFVKHVLKDSSAAKLFSLREGDQLLSTTIFFDDIKYEDALKILQYSEPYKVQFKVKRRVPAREDAASGPQWAPKPTKKQEKDVADGSTDTPTKTMEGDGDEERLIAKPRDGRGRRTQKDRLSWPKFQAIKSKRGRGPRRSHSTSEAYERGKVHATAPTSSDTEAECPADEREQEAGAGSRRKSRFLNLKFKVGSGKGPSLVRQPGTGPQSGAVHPGVLEEAASWDYSQEATWAGAHGRKDDATVEAPQGTPAPSCKGALGGEADMAPRPQGKTTERGVQDETVPRGKPRTGPAPGQDRGGPREGMQGLEMGAATSLLQDRAGDGHMQGRKADCQVRILSLKTPKFGFSEGKVRGTEGAPAVLERGTRHGRLAAGAVEKGGESTDSERGTEPAAGQPARNEGTRDGDRTGGETAGGGTSMEGRQETVTTWKLKRPSFQWSQETEAGSANDTRARDAETENQRRRHSGEVTAQMDSQDADKSEEKRLRRSSKVKAEPQRSKDKETHIAPGDKEVVASDGKFKMPKFKMPSFGVSVTTKELGTSVDAPVPKITGEATMPSLEGEIAAQEGRMQLPSSEIELPGGEVEVALPEGEVRLGELKSREEGTRFKGHLPKVQMPSIKMPKVDFKGPQVDIKGPQVDIKGPKLDMKGAEGKVVTPDLEMSLPSVEADIQVPGSKLEGDHTLGDEEAATRDTKFKMPKFKMPSFGASAPSMSTDTSVDVKADMHLPCIQADVKAGDLSIDLPSADVGVKTRGLGVKLPEGPVAEGELQEPATRVGLKGQLPKVQMPSIKMPKLDIKGGQVDIKGPQVDITGPKLDLKGAKGEVATPDLAVSLPNVEVDIQAPGAKVGGDITLGDKEATTRHTKFKMPTFKMPSFGMSVTTKELGTSVDVPVPKITGEATMPSLEGEIAAQEGRMQLPSSEIELPGGEVEVALPEGEVRLGDLKGKAEGASFRGHLPKVQMPSIKMPKVDIKGPKVDIKAPEVDITGPKVDLKSTKGEVAIPDMGVSLPSVEVDIHASGTRLEGDIALGDKEVAARDSKFKMPKFKMPSFSISGPRKSTDASVDIAGPQVQADMRLPSIQTDVKAGDLSIDLPSVDVDVKTGELSEKLPEGHVPEGELQEPPAGVRLKGQLPKLHMPSFKMPKVDFKGPQVDVEGPQVDITGRKLDLKGAKGEVATPDLEVSLPNVEVDIQAPGANLEGDIALGDKEVAVRDSKFKMPKFKMPSFGVSVTTKELGTSVDVPVPKITGEATMPSLEGEIAAQEGHMQLPSSEIELPGGEVEVALPEGEVRLGELKIKAEGTRFKGHLPKMQMPSIKMPKVDIKGPKVDITSTQLDITGPKLDLKGAKGEVATPDLGLSGPTVEVDIQMPGSKLEGDISLGDREAAASDSKFKMPKFKMPSFSISGPRKSTDASVDIAGPQVQADMRLPSIQTDVKAGDLSIDLPSVDVDVKTGELSEKLPEGHVPEGELQEPPAGVRLKGQLPKLHMPSFKMPKVDFKGPQVDVEGPHGDITGPKLDLKGPKGEVATSDLEVSLPKVEVDIQAPGSKLEGDITLGDKEVATRDSKFKMPTFKMPSFGVSVTTKELGTSVDAPVPKITGEATMPSLEGEIAAQEGRMQLPSSEIELPGGEVEVALPEGEVRLGDLKGKAEGARFKGHLPKVQMPSMKMPKVDFKGPQVDIKGPQVDIKGPKLDMKGAKGKVVTPDLEMSLPSVEADIQVPGSKLEGDITLGDEEAAARDTKFKMPKFKMPSFGVSVTTKELGTSVDVPVPKITGEATMPSLEGEIAAQEGRMQLPSSEIELPGGEVEVALPEGEVRLGELKSREEGTRFKGHLPQVQMPSIKMPKVDIEGPKVDIKPPEVDITGPKLDLKGMKDKVSMPSMRVSLPNVEVDIQEPGAKLEGDISLGDKEAVSRDTTLKMPKFKLPTFGVSVTTKELGTSVDIAVPKITGEATMPSLEGEIAAQEGRMQLPSSEIELPGGEVEVALPEGEVRLGDLRGKAEGARFKGHLPKVQMPSIKMPKVDIKGPQVDIKGPQVDITGPKLDVKGAKGEVATPDMGLSGPTVELDTQAPGTKLEGVISLGEKEAVTRDVFKMPKFKTPSFGMSLPSKELGTSVDVVVPKITGEVTLPSLEGEIAAQEGRMQLPSSEIELPGGEVQVALPEDEVRLGELKIKAEGTRFKGHLPKMQMPSIKMPKVDIKGPKVDITSTQLDITGPKLDLKGAKGEVATPDLGVSLPTMEVDIQMPGSKLEGDISLGDKEAAASDTKFKMPKFKMPSFGMSVTTKELGTSVDIAVPKITGEATMPSLEGEIAAQEGRVQLPSSEIELPGGEVEVALPEGEVRLGDLRGKAEGASFKGHVPKVQMPSMKMPRVDFKGPQVDIKGPQVDIKGPKLDMKGAKGKVVTPDLEMSLPSVEADIQAPGSKLQGDLTVGDEAVVARDSKFKMPKFNMPSFGMSVTTKELGTSVDIPVPKITGEVTLPSLEGEIAAQEGRMQVPSSEIELPGGEVEVALPEGEVRLGDLKGKAEGASFRGHLPKVQMPSIKMPKVDFKGPQVDIKGPQVDIKGPKRDMKGAKGKVVTPDLEMSLPSVEADIQAPGSKLEGDITLGDEEAAARDTKFKMPKFKMPSFGVSVTTKELGTSVDVPVPKITGEATMPSLEGEIAAQEGRMQLPSSEIELPGGEVEVALPEGEVRLGELKSREEGTRFKGHLPQVQMPSIKMPKVDIEGPKVDIKPPEVDITGPKLDLKGMKDKVSMPSMRVSLPDVEVDIQEPGAKLEGDISLGDKEAVSRDTTLKMPKFKLPTFGVSVTTKELGTSVDIAVPKITGEATMPSLEGEIAAQEGRVQLPSSEIELPGGEVEVALPEGEVRLGDLRGKAEGARFKGHLPKVQMPSIKMPKVDIKGPQVDIKGPQVDITGPKLDVKGAKGEVATPDMGLSGPTVELDTQAPGTKLEGVISLGEKEAVTRDVFKMPKFKTPSFGMSLPSKELGTSVDVVVPKITGEVTLPSLEGEIAAQEGRMQLPSSEIELPGGEVQVALPEDEVRLGELKIKAEGTRFKGHLPKMQMPSIKMPKVDIKGPKVDITSTQLDITGPKLDLKGAKGEVATPDLGVSLPTMEVDIQMPGSKLEGDISLGDKEAAASDTKFKMPKFKMPSFGVSVTTKELGTSVDVPVPKITGEVTLPSLEGEIAAQEGRMQLPSSEIELPGGEVEVALPEGEVRLGDLRGKAEGASFKGHLPKVQMPSMKMPKVDFKGPQVDIKGPQVDIKGPKMDMKGAEGKVVTPDLEMSLPSVEADIQAPGSKLEGDITLGDEEAATRDTKFKMPKFKMPSFGASAPKMSTDTSVHVKADMHLPCIQADVKAGDLSIDLPSADVGVKTRGLGVKLPEGPVAEGELQEPATRVGLKGQLPKVQMPSIKMPKLDIKGGQVDIKGPQVDITGPKLDLKGAKGEVATPDLAVSLPNVEVDIQAPGAKVGGDITLGDKEATTRHTKFKMPTFKMPSFGMSVTTKELGTSVDVPVPKITGEATMPSLEGEIAAQEGRMQLPSSEIELPGGEVEVALPEGEVRLGDVKGKAEGARFKGHLPKVQMPSIKMPKVDFKGPKVDIKAPEVDITGPKVDLKSTKGEVAIPDMGVSLPSVEVDIHASGTRLEGDIALGDKEVAARDSKFKMPKFKMPSFSISGPRKSTDASVDITGPQVQADMRLPSIQTDVKAGDLSIDLPSVDVDVKTGELSEKLPEGHVPEGELQEPPAGVRLKGQLPKLHMPSFKMPKVDFTGPQVDVKGPHGDITGPKLDLKGPKREVATSDLEVSLPKVKVDIQAPGANLEGDIALGDKEVATRDSKFKMPKFKMPSFGMSAPNKELGSSVDVSVPTITAKVTLPSGEGEIPSEESSVQLPSSEVELPGGEMEVVLPEGEVRLGELKGKAEGARFKGHLPKVQMPSIKMPKVDIKGPKVDIKAPEVDITGPKVDLKSTKGEVAIPDMGVSLPSVEVDIQAPGAKLEGDIALGDKEVAARDSKFKMPKFKMPSFSISGPRKSTDASVDIAGPQVQADMHLPSIQADIKSSDLSIDLPSGDMDLKTGELGVKLPEGHVSEGELQEPSAGVRLKGQLPKLHMPGFKMPKVDFKGPQVDIKGPQVDITEPKQDVKGAKGEVATPDMGLSPSTMQVDIQAPGAKLEGEISLGGKEAAARDSKFKMPKFKMPSFGISVPSMSSDASVDVQADVRLPSIQTDVKAGDLSIDLPSADVGVKTGELGVKIPEGPVPEGELQEPTGGVRLKGQLPKLHMPSFKMPKVDFKGPQVDIKGPQVDIKGPQVDITGPQGDIRGRKLDLKGAKGEVATPDLEVSLPNVEVDIQAPGANLEGDIALGDKEVATRDSKFKMPKFKMPSFGMSAPNKELGSSVDVPVPTITGKVTLPSGEGEIPSEESSVQLPSSEVELPGGEMEVVLPEGEVRLGELKGKAEGARFKGHLPKVQMPSIKMPKLDIKGGQVDIKGPKVDITGPKLDVKSAKGEVAVPDLGVSLPIMEVDIQAPGAKLEGDIALGDKEAAARDSKFKMPKFKMPSFGVSVTSKELGKSVDMHVPKTTGAVATLSHLDGEIPAKEGSVQVPSSEVELPGGEAEVALPEGEVRLGELKGKAKGTRSKGHLPKVQMPSIKMPKVDIKGPKVDIKAPEVDITGPKVDLKSTKGEVAIPDMGVSPPGVKVDIQAPGAKLEGDIALGDKEAAAASVTFTMPGVSVPSSRSTAKESSVASSQVENNDRCGFELGGGGSPRERAAFGEPSMAVPRLSCPGVPSGSLDLTRPHAESSTLPSCEGVTLTKYQVTVPRATISAELPPGTIPESEGDAHVFIRERTADLPSRERISMSQTESHPGPVDPLCYTSCGRVTFPKFHRPKFVFSAPGAGDVEGTTRAVGGTLCPLSPVWGVDSSAKEATLFPGPGPLAPSAGVSMSEVTEDPVGTAQMAAVTPGRAPAEDADREEKGSPLKMPQFKIPSFRRSPKKATDPTGYPEHSQVADVGAKGSSAGRPVPQMEADLGREKGEVKAPGFAKPKPTAPDMRASTGGADLLQGDPDPSLSSSLAEGQATVRVSGEDGAMVDPLQGASVDLHLPQVHLCRVGFVQPDLRPTEVQVEVSQSAGKPPLPKHSLSLGDDSGGRGLGDGSASHPRGEVMDPSTEDPLQASRRTAEAAAPTAGSAEGEAAVGDAWAGSQGRWFRMPSLRLPGLWGSSGERGVAQVPSSAASATQQGDAPAAVRSQGVHAPESEVEVAVSPRAPEAEADVAAVLQQTVGGKGLNLHLSPAGMSSSDLPTSEVQLRPGQGSLPLQMPSGRLSETKVPPGEMRKTPARASEKAEHQPSAAEGPLKLKASTTDVPSQISVVDMGQLWEDSVLTVKFPTLKVPRFTFPAPSSTADVFIPTVREVWCPDSSLDLAMRKESPGAWGASILKAGAGVPREPPVVLAGASEAPPVSKVRVHIQGARVESQEVTIHSRVTAEFADRSGPEAFSTQIVRESEIPASKIQLPSYGFSLLKGKVPEHPSQAQVYVVTQDSGSSKGLQEAPQQVTTGVDPSSGDLQPDTGEPFEMISSSLKAPGPQTLTFEVRSGHQFADSCSDEEPVEILEFPPEDGREAATPTEDEDGEAEEKPESKRSGLFRFWLPSIGFSSSAGEAGSGAAEDVPRSAPVPSQPEARPEAEPPKKQEKAGWFRFPKLGFSSSPTKKSQSAEDKAALAEPQLQEEAVTFFDAQETLSPEEMEDGQPARAVTAGPGPRATVTSAARTEVVLLEQRRKAGDEPTPGPATK